MFGLVMPSLQGLVTRRVAATEQGRLQGALGSIRAVASVTAPILFTQVFAASVGGSLAGAPFLLGAALLVGSLLLTSRDRGSTASLGATSGAVG
jgi:DHA1 family tetracycline resistance protein-like MFS transporter